MALPPFLKKKRTYIILGLLVVAYFGISWLRGGKTGTTYETAAVEKRDLLQTVEVTGELKPAARIDLSFKNGGTINVINVKVGAVVKKGDVLAELKADDVTFAARSADAALSLAQANLRAKIAGETTQSIRVATAAVDSAQASYDKAVADLESTKLTTADAVRVATLAVQTATNNLANQGATYSQTVQNAYESARASMQTALGPLQTALVDGDQITSVDNTASNQTYLNVLAFLDIQSLEHAKSSYLVAKASKNIADTRVKALTSASTKQQILDAGDAVSKAVNDMQAYLTDVQKVLAASLTNSYLTTTILSGYKTTIDADRTTISTQNSTVLTAIQAIKNSELTQTQSVAQLQDAYDTAVTNLQTAQTNATTQVRTAETNVEIQKAGLEQAKASLDQKKAPPREVDLAGLRASVEQAQVNADKAENDLQNIQIIAPVDGIVSEVIPSIGELIQSGVTAIRLVGTSQYDIEALAPEADIAKVDVGQTASITLDAYGDAVVFNGTVTAEDPDQTKVQDAVYYKIRVQIEPAGHDIKPGMTANVTVKTDERKGAIVIPLRAVRTAADETKSVRVMKNNMPENRAVEIGLRGDEGRVEVTKGLAEGEIVVTGETSAGAPTP